MRERINDLLARLRGGTIHTGDDSAASRGPYAEAAAEVQAREFLQIAQALASKLYEARQLAAVERASWTNDEFHALQRAASGRNTVVRAAVHEAVNSMDEMARIIRDHGGPPKKKSLEFDAEEVSRIHEQTLANYSRLYNAAADAFEKLGAPPG